MSALRLNPRMEHLIRDAFLDFQTSREVKNCSPKTLTYYDDTAGRFADCLEAEGVTDPAAITSRLVRQYLASVKARGLKDSSQHAHARGIRAWLNFLHAEGYLPEPLMVDMPRVKQVRPPMVGPDDLDKILHRGCRSKRDKAAILFMVGTGLRRAEVCALNWGDVDLKAGVVRVRAGKGGKARSVMAGPKVRRALLAFRRSVSPDYGDPVFPSQKGGARLTGSGLRNWLRRIGNRAGVKLTAHMLRRGFATASLSAGLDLITLQRLMGHSSLKMVEKYVRLVEADLKEAYKQHDPVDLLLG